MTAVINDLKVEGTIPFVDYLQASQTRGFLVIHGDELIYEGYFNGSEREETITSLSVAKSFLSTLIGIAIHNGELTSLDDPVTRYIPELIDRDDRFEKITLRHLITMSSGLKFEEEWSPFARFLT